MANIFKPKYKDGHLVSIKPKTQGSVLSILKKYGLDPTKVLSLIKRPLSKSQNLKLMIIPMGTGKEVLHAELENKSKVFSFRGAKTTIENLFDHYGKNTGKSATDKKTKTKEMVSLCLIENKLKKGTLVDEDFVDDCLPNELKFELFDPIAEINVGDRIVTWGSDNGKPFVAGVPVGEIVSIKSTPGLLTKTAKVKPYVKISNLDLLAVVVEPPRIDPRDSLLPPMPVTATPSAEISPTPSPSAS